MYRSVVEHREQVSQVKSLILPADVPHREILVPFMGGHAPIRVYCPTYLDPPYPTILYIPGTAFVAREMAFTEMICTRLAAAASCQVVLIYHRLAPEDPFPAGLRDAYSVVFFIMNRGSRLFQIDKAKTILVGYSSGGNFAASIAVRMMMQSFPMLRQVLISPMLDLSQSLVFFRKDFEEKDKAIRQEFVHWFLNLYIPKGMDLKNPWLSPFWHSPKNFLKLPPTDVFFAEYDRFRSDAEAYYSTLQNIGVEVCRFVIKGADHSFLWHQPQVVEAIGARVKITCGTETMPMSITTSQPRLFCRNKRATNEQSSQDASPVVKAKL